VFFKATNRNLFIFNTLYNFFQKATFGFLFFAVVRFSPPSQEGEAAKRKAEAENIRRIRKSRPLTFWLRLCCAKQSA